MIDENAVVKAAIELDIPDYRAREVIAAYLTAAPPAPVGDMGELVKRLRWRGEHTSDQGATTPTLCREAAAAITSLSAMLAEADRARLILAHTDIGSLPNDWTLEQIAEARIDDLIKLRGQVRDTCRRAEAAEARLAECENENYELRLIIMGGEDAPGFAGSVPLNTLRDQMQRERLDMSQSLEASAARLAEIIVADAATNYAKHLVVALAEEFPAIPEWQPLDSLIGILSQIDNMTVGLVSQRDEARARVEALETALIYVRDSGLLSPLGTAFKTVCAALSNKGEG